MIQEKRPSIRGLDTRNSRVGAILFFGFYIFLFPSLLFADFNSGKQAFDAGDYRTAFSEWKTSADQGDADSQFELGKLYEEGLGTIQDFVLAHAYFNLAASSGHKDARIARNQIPEKMSKEELTEARGLARRWQPVQESPQMAQPVPQPVPAPQASAPPQAPQSPPIENTQEGLFKASKENNTETIKRILTSGVDVNTQDSKGRTALFFGTYFGHEKVVKTLIAAGANTEAKSKSGMTAKDIAVKKGYSAIAKLLTPLLPSKTKNIEERSLQSETTKTTKFEPETKKIPPIKKAPTIKKVPMCWDDAAVEYVPCGTRGTYGVEYFEEIEVKEKVALPSSNEFIQMCWDDAAVEYVECGTQGAYEDEITVEKQISNSFKTFEKGNENQCYDNAEVSYVKCVDGVFQD
jgi:hypothetical protein